jgi:Ala-tRNA(Pro) deacylase
MFYISDIMTKEPGEYKNHLQKETYKALKDLKIPFERVETDETDFLPVYYNGEKSI